MLTTILLPNRVLVADTSPMDILSGNEMVEETAFDLHAAIADVETCYEALTDAIVPYANKKSRKFSKY